jgi:hypothetical protein
MLPIVHAQRASSTFQNAASVTVRSSPMSINEIRVIGRSALLLLGLVGLQAQAGTQINPQSRPAWINCPEKRSTARSLPPEGHQFVERRRNWQGSTLTFSISAKMGFTSTPMKGTIEVTGWSYQPTRAIHHLDSVNELEIYLGRS